MSLAKIFNRLSLITSLEYNWNSYRSDPPNNKALSNFFKFLELLPENLLLDDDAVINPSAEGGVVFRNNRGLVEFLNDGYINVVNYFGQRNILVYDSIDDLPKDIVNHFG